MSQSTPPARVAVVTGGNRGIGLEVCRQLAQHGWQVVLTSRDEGKGREAAATLGVEWHALDVTNAESIGRLRDQMQRQYGRVDALVNNAAILLDKHRTVLDVEP